MNGIVVVLDAGSSVGGGVIEAAVRARRPAVAVSPDRTALARLQARYPGEDLTFLVGSAVDESSAAALASDLRQLKRPLTSVVVARACEPSRGRVIDESGDTLLRSLQEEVLPHLAAAHVLIPLLAQSGRNGSYLVIDGPGGEQPWAGYGHRSICAAATRMLIRVLHEEARARAVRVQLLAVEMPVRTDENQRSACTHWPTAVAIGLQAMALLDPTTSHGRAAAIVRTCVDGPFHTLDSYADSAPSAAELDDTWARLAPLLQTPHHKA